MDEIKKILEKLIENHGNIIYDDENMECNFCGNTINQYVPAMQVRKEDCIITRAKKVLEKI